MSWIEKNQKPLLAVGAILGIAWFGGRYFDESESFSAEKVKIDWEAVAKEEWESGYPHDDDLLSYQNKQANKSLLSCLNSYLKVAKDEVTMGHYDYPDLAEYTITPEYEKAHGREPSNAEIDKALPKVIKGLRKQARTGRYRGADWEELSKALKSPTSRYEWGQAYEGAYHSKGRKGWFTGDDYYEPLNAETFEADPEYDGMNYHGDLPYDVMKDAYEQARKKKRNPVIRDGKKVSPSDRADWEYYELDDDTIDSGYITVYYKDPSDPHTLYAIIFDFDTSDVTPHEYGYWNYPNFNFDPVNPRGYASYVIGHGEDEGKIISSHRFTSMGAETFEAMSFKQWSDDEMHEPKHGGSQMQFDDWLEEEIDSHGDIPLSEWGYEEEHDEKEHQHSESFNAEHSSDAIETFRQIMMAVSSNSKESYDDYKNAPKDELANHLLEMWCEDQDDLNRPTLGSSYNSYLKMMYAFRNSKKAESFNAESLESLTSIVSKYIPDYEGLSHEQVIELIKEEGIDDLAQDEEYALRESIANGDELGIRNAKALETLRKRVSEMYPEHFDAEEMACETCGCKKKAETFEAKGDCAECYGTGGLYDSHMGINDECHSCGGTGFEY